MYMQKICCRKVDISFLLQFPTIRGVTVCYFSRGSHRWHDNSLTVVVCVSNIERMTRTQGFNVITGTSLLLRNKHFNRNERNIRVFLRIVTLPVSRDVDRDHHITFRAKTNDFPSFRVIVTRMSIRPPKTKITCRTCDQHVMRALQHYKCRV